MVILCSWLFLSSLVLLLLRETSATDDHATPLHISLFSPKKPRPNRPAGLADLRFCKECESPRAEGSHIDALNSYQGPQSFDLVSELIYAVPNDGSRPPMSPAQLSGSVALFDRGAVSLVEKVIHAQNCGAVAVVLIDDGTCTDDGYSHCGAAGRLADGGFAKRDRYDMWSKVEIPAVFITEGEGQRILNNMHLEEVSIPGLGEQWVSV